MVQLAVTDRKVQPNHHPCAEEQQIIDVLSYNGSPHPLVWYFPFHVAVGERRVEGFRLWLWLWLWWLSSLSVPSFFSCLGVLPLHSTPLHSLGVYGNSYGAIGESKLGAAVGHPRLYSWGSKSTRETCGSVRFWQVEIHSWLMTAFQPHG